jgi:hypothetical protein
MIVLRQGLDQMTNEAANLSSRGIEEALGIIFFPKFTDLCVIHSAYPKKSRQNWQALTIVIMNSSFSSHMSLHSVVGASTGSRVEDAEIARIWAENFPRRAESELSRQLCALICRIVDQRSHFFAKPGVDSEAKSRALRSLGIKEWEFDQFLTERLNR